MQRKNKQQQQQEEYILLLTYSWYTAKFVLSIWSILFWGATGSHCAPPGDQIQMYISAFGQGHWIDINLTHVF